MTLEVLHHDGSASGVDWFDIALGVAVVLVLVGLGFVLYRVVRRRRLD